MSKSYNERQKEFIKMHGLKVGSFVKVIGKADSYEDGWKNTWGGSRMENAVGNVFPINSFNGSVGIELGGDAGGYDFPYWVLKPVDGKKSVAVKLNDRMNATFDKKNITVTYGDSKIVIPMSAFEQLMGAVDESRKS